MQQVYIIFSNAFWASVEISSSISNGRKLFIIVLR